MERGLLAISERPVLVHLSRSSCGSFASDSDRPMTAPKLQVAA
jgi:hypothetical protein